MAVVCSKFRLSSRLDFVRFVLFRLEGRSGLATAGPAQTTRGSAESSRFGPEGCQSLWDI